jgi:hypothetical protein
MTDTPAPSKTPSRKVAVGGAAGALATIICWASAAFGGVEIPAEIAVAITALFTFALQYAVPDKETP